MQNQFFLIKLTSVENTQGSIVLQLISAAETIVDLIHCSESTATEKVNELCMLHIT